MSVLVLTQVPAQLDSPLWQESEQVPLLQTSPFLQMVPHLPQWLLSVEVLTHRPAQLVRPV